MCWGFAIIDFGFAGRLWLGLLCLAIAGAADMISGVFRMLIWNQTIPDHLRGRLAGIELISYHTGPMLGNAESGIVASLFSIRTSVVSGGILCVREQDCCCWHCLRFELTMAAQDWCESGKKKTRALMRWRELSKGNLIALAKLYCPKICCVD